APVGAANASANHAWVAGWNGASAAWGDTGLVFITPLSYTFGPRGVGSLVARGRSSPVWCHRWGLQGRKVRFGLRGKGRKSWSCGVGSSRIEVRNRGRSIGAGRLEACPTGCVFSTLGD